MDAVDSEAVPQALEANPVSDNQRVSSELRISQFSVVHYFQNFGKSMQSCQIVFHITKIMQNFLLTLVFVLISSSLLFFLSKVF